MQHQRLGRDALGQAGLMHELGGRIAALSVMDFPGLDLPLSGALFRSAAVSGRWGPRRGVVPDRLRRCRLCAIHAAIVLAQIPTTQDIVGVVLVMAGIAIHVPVQ